METRTVALGMLLLLLGSANTLVSKYQNMTVVGHTSKGEVVYFQHPAVQTGFMFFGELLCLIPYFIWKWIVVHRRQPDGRGHFSPMVTSPSEADLLSGRVPHLTSTAEEEQGGVSVLSCLSSKNTKKVFAFFIPAAFDAFATVCLYTGLLFTYASTFQMLRGTMVMWCGLLTIFMLRRNLHIHHWVGICMIAAGSMLVTASSVLDDDPTQTTSFPAPRVSALSEKESIVAQFPLFGAGFVMLGQLMSAIQFVVEERYLAKYRVPALLAVGLEGFWGIILCFVVLPVLSLVTATDGMPLDDVPQAFSDIMNTPRLQILFAINMVCVASFNLLALIVTSELGAASRAAIDTLRTLIIWTASVVVFEWEYFHGLQVVGFAVLVAGMSLYNELMRSCLRHSTAGDESPIGTPGGGPSHSTTIFNGDRSARGSGLQSLQTSRSGSSLHRMPGGPPAPLTVGPTAPGSPRKGGGSPRAMNMPSGSVPRSPLRPPLHPNSFGSNQHFARSLTYNPDVLSPHSLGSYGEPLLGRAQRQEVAASSGLAAARNQAPSGEATALRQAPYAPPAVPPPRGWPGASGGSGSGGAGAGGEAGAGAAPSDIPGSHNAARPRATPQSSLTMSIGASKLPEPPPTSSR